MVTRLRLLVLFGIVSTVAGQTPAIRTLVNGASFAAGQPVGPGSIVTIFGSGLATAPAGAQSVPLPTALGNVTVAVNGRAMPLFYVSASQINGQLPYEVTPGKATAVVTSGAKASASFQFDVAPTAPGIFVWNFTRAVAQNSDLQLNTAEHAAKVKDYITVYLTGIGNVDNPVPTGSVAPPTTLSRPVGKVSVTIGDRPAEVQFAGLTPGSVGLAQANIRVPDMPAGEYPLRISVGGVSGDSAVVSVEGALVELLTNGAKLDFVPIPAGEFIMGCSPNDGECYDDEYPTHLVKITRPFEMSKYELTDAQWYATMGTLPSDFPKYDRPVENVNWSEVQWFLLELNNRKDGYLYRLPTEAEWEYAARAGNTAKNYGNLADAAWYSGTVTGDRTQPVGLKLPNAWGLYDMFGNVSEWCQDWYDRGYYAVSPAADPPGSVLTARRVLRGGSWIDKARDLRVSGRVGVQPETRQHNVGFRCVREKIR